MNRQTAPEPRIVELDAVRGIAAAMVLICHLPRGFWFGKTGVDLFFVLSGFLISGIILRNREKPGFLKVFYTRRALRIFPIYYLALIGMVLINAFAMRNPGRIDGIWYYLAYFQNVPLYWGGTIPPVDLTVGHTWTLAIEEQFYLMWPLALVTLRPNRIPWLCSCLIISPVLLRHFGLARTTLFGHADGLAWGGLLAWIELSYGTSHRAILNRIYLFVGLAGFALYFAVWAFLSPVEMTAKGMIGSNVGIVLVSIAYFGTIGFVQALSGNRWLSFLRWRPLVALGTISYGLYLYHWIIYGYLDTAIKFMWNYGDPWWLDVLKVTLSLGTAVTSWFCIEKPLLRLKDRLSYGGTPRASVLPATAEAATRV